MSRIGKKIINVPSGVEVNIDGNRIAVKGPKGSLNFEHAAGMSLALDGSELTVKVTGSRKNASAVQGLTRALIQNMVTGVTEGYTKSLEINGVGFKAAVKGSTLVLNVGFSHPVEFNIPEGVTATVEKNIITLAGIDKKLVGQVAAEIRAIRKPEPYKGKGIKYVDEVIRRKVGKVMKSATA